MYKSTHTTTHRSGEENPGKSVQVCIVQAVSYVLQDLDPASLILCGEDEPRTEDQVTSPRPTVRKCSRLFVLMASCRRWAMANSTRFPTGWKDRVCNACHGAMTATRIHTGVTQQCEVRRGSSRLGYIFSRCVRLLVRIKLGGLPCVLAHFVGFSGAHVAVLQAFIGSHLLYMINVFKPMVHGLEQCGTYTLATLMGTV